MEKKIKKEKIDRREFLKRLGAGAAVSAAVRSAIRRRATARRKARFRPIG